MVVYVNMKLLQDGLVMVSVMELMAIEIMVNITVNLLTGMAGIVHVQKTVKQLIMLIQVFQVQLMLIMIVRLVKVMVSNW